MTETDGGGEGPRRGGGFREWSGGLVTAFRTLTVLPVPGREASSRAAALPWFPVVGLVIGALQYAAGAAGAAGAAALSASAAAGGKWPEGAALLVLLVGILMTGGLHLDGLADWADGFFGARDKQRTLAIMKDSQTGAFGATALCLVLLAKWAAYSRLCALGLAPWIITAAVTSRTTQTVLAVRLPYARAEGGTAAPFVEGARPGHAVAALLLGTLALAPLCLTMNSGAPLYGLVGGLLLAGVFGFWCRRRVGGVTGDLLGAGSELVETAVLLVGAALGPRLFAL